MWLRLFVSTSLLALLSRATVLVDFQVAQPPPVPRDAQQCTVQILQYVLSLNWLAFLRCNCFFFFTGVISPSRLEGIYTIELKDTHFIVNLTPHSAEVVQFSCVKMKENYRVQLTRSPPDLLRIVGQSALGRPLL